MVSCIVVRGGGDIATGVVHALFQCGLRCVVLESQTPSAIRRKVSLCEAVYQNTATVEGVSAQLVHSAREALDVLKGRSSVPVLIDPACAFLDEANKAGIKVAALIDAIIAKRNTGVHRDIAPITIALGPGFAAGESGDADVVIETMRGHNLGRILTKGCAEANTGEPGIIAGFGRERVIHAPAFGVIELIHDIGDTVSKGCEIARIKDGNEMIPVAASIDGILRGIIRNGYAVHKGMKIADIDPRLSERENCFTISDKARAIGNSALHALLMLASKNGFDLWKD